MSPWAFVMFCMMRSPAAARSVSYASGDTDAFRFARSDGVSWAAPSAVVRYVRYALGLSRLRGPLSKRSLRVRLRSPNRGSNGSVPNETGRGESRRVRSD
jgi:hypothetical protein